MQQVGLLFLGFNVLGQQAPPKELYNSKDQLTVCSRGVVKEPNTAIKKTNKFLANCPGTMATWASYSGSALVQQLKAATDYDGCLRTLFSFDASYGPSLFSNANVAIVAQEMYSISISHDGTLNSGMLGLATYLHAASYHDFFQTSVNFDANSTQKYNNAVESFANNAHLWDVTENALLILDEYLIMCDATGLRHKPAIINVVKTAMKNLTVLDNWKTIVNDDALMQKYVTAYNRMFFLMFRGIQPVDPLFESALNTDSEFISLMSKLATDSELKTNNTLELIPNNSIGEMVRMMTSSVLKPKVEPYLADIVKTLPRLTPNWYRIIKAINESGNCSAYSLCENIDAIKSEIDNMLFPNTFTFDDGKLVVKTPLSYETVLPLYYASKQVQAQVFRFIETDAAVANDPNIKLNMVVYGTLANYQDWQTLLNGIDTNNGGMYIERGATFYTYERTTMESTFSLEELFRHEYVHYLQGRYMANGFWGESPIYKNNRLVWFEEGMAEHFAGSTDTQGVTIRESQGSAIKNEGPSEYMTVSQILSADYNNGFKFYRYGNMLWSHWFKNDMATAKELVRLVRADDVAGYDAKINQLKANSALQTSFVNYLNNTVIKHENWWAVTTPWKEDKLYTVGAPADVQTEFIALTGKTAIAALEATTSLRRFSLTGTFTNGNFDTSLNDLIKKLNTSPTINNFKYLTGYYKNISGNTATYVITGPLRNASVDDAVDAQFSSSTVATITGGSVKFKNQSTGYIKSYLWSFPGGTPATSTDAEPIVNYLSAGNYNVELVVNGNNNSSNTMLKKDYISIYSKPTRVYCNASVVYDYSSILNVTFANINNDSQGFPLNGYADFTNFLAQVDPGKSYPIEVYPAHSAQGNNINVWIDWNQNGLFTDPGERVFSYEGINAVGSILIPSNATPGVTRMRVRYSYGKTSDPCGEDSYFGEVEDYSVLVKSSSNTVSIATPTNLVALPNISSLMVELSWIDNATNETSYVVERALPNGVYNLLATLSADATTYTDTGLMAGVTYSYRVTAKSNAVSSMFSNVVVVPMSITPTQTTLAKPIITDGDLYDTGFYAYWNTVINATVYEIELKNSLGEWTSFSTTIEGLLWVPKSGTQTIYDFRVRAKNATEFSPWSYAVANLNDKTFTLSTLFYELKKKGFAMYPNPASETVNFSFTNMDTNKITTTIYNLEGAVIDVIKNPLSYSLKGLSSGMYLVVVSDGIFKQTKKLIIK